ncbi:pyridoxal phosphate-dependent aminotransferase [Aliidiomarina soli]|uniref:Aminotransferase n=1 Tax=Aliidiomarina soli TaxID=1928574 RepID=A0A432WFJ9_9GAMM|nr:aminotransferase class I/II-fold pyridoxal phosphate-dependent enzyme [Aliidiomarina soli]RUO32560.1 aspartate aminotransferase [Aliidiomarina soli]
MTEPQVQALSPAVQINLNIRGMKPSATVAINERSAELQAQGREVLKLGLGQSPFPVPKHVQQALRDNAQQKDYLAVKGLPALRQSISAYLKRTQGLDYDAQNILIGPGTKELMFIMQLTYYGDLVIPSPSWVSYAPQARILGRNLHWLRTSLDSGLGVTPEVLEELCQQDPDLPRLLILNYPSNPTGLAYSEDQLKAIAEVARRYRVLVLSDEIYGGVNFSGEHISIARYYPEGTIISDGISKWSGAGGWRLGAFVFPPQLKWLADAMAVVASETFTSTSAPIQYAAIEAFQQNPAMESYLHQSRAVLEALANYAYDRLTSAGAQAIKPQGGFYLFPSFEAVRERILSKGIQTSDEFCQRLLDEKGVACLPGSCFGRPASEFSVRIAYVDFDGEAALDALEAGATLDHEFLRRYCGRVVEAIDRMHDFIS